MTPKEILEHLRFDRDMAGFNPMTGEQRPMNEDCAKTVEALDFAIPIIEAVINDPQLMRQVNAIVSLYGYDAVGETYLSPKGYDAVARRTLSEGMTYGETSIVVDKHNKKERGMEL